MHKFLYGILSLMPVFAFSQNLSSKIQIPVEKYELSNGLRVLLNPDDKFHSASYILGFAVGSRHESLGITGISHMFEHLMFKGTKKYPFFDKTLSSNGVIGVNAFTSRDYTAYLGTFLPEKLELILDMESDRMSNLTFTQEELDKERGAVQEERLRAVDNNPMGFLFENLMDLRFAKHPYRWPIIGYAKDIANYSLKDLRSWYGAYYSPNNAVLVISGKFSVKDAKKWIAQYFGPLARKDRPKEIKVIEPESKTPRSRKAFKEIQSPKAALTYLAPPGGTKEFYALEFISHILGSGESSLLYKKMVREKKLLSSISSSAWDMLDHSLFLIFYSLLDLSKEEEVKKQVLDILKEGFDQALNNKSLEKVKNIQMNNMIYSLKRSSARTRLILDYEMNFNDYKKMYEKLDLLNEMTPQFIRQVGEKYLSPEKLTYVILKPKK